jgi:hypothetical protein
MAITFANNIITVMYESGDAKGGTLANPYTFTDIYNADVAGGWGKVTKNGNTYYINARLDVLNNVTLNSTYFRALSENVTFADQTGQLLYVYLPYGGACNCESCNFYSEKQEDALTITAGGNILNCSFYYFQRINLSGNLMAGGTLYIKRTEFKYGLIIYPRASSVYMEDVSFYNFQYPLSPFFGFDNLRIKVVNCYWSFYLMYLQTDLTLRNLVIKNSTKNDIAFRPYTKFDVKAILIDSEVDYNDYMITLGSYGSQWLILKSSFVWYFGETVNVLLTDKDGYEILNKSVDDGNVDEVIYHTHFVATNSSGQLANDDLVTLEPFKLVVSKEGYDDIEIANITITSGQPTIIRGNLKPSTPPIYYQQVIDGEIGSLDLSGAIETTQIDGVIDNNILNGEVNIVSLYADLEEIYKINMMQ